MNKEEMLRAMELIEDEFVAEAAPERVKEAAAEKPAPKISLGGRKWSWLTVGAAGLAAAVAAMWLFIPFHTGLPSVVKHSDSQYYELIQKLNEATYVRPRAKNNYEKYIRGPVKSSFDYLYGATEDAMEAPTANESQEIKWESGLLSYEEITDNQVAGVIEADRIKRSDKYIYYLYSDTLRVYSIEGEESKEVGSYRITSNEAIEVFYKETWEFYLSEDCTKIILTGSFADKQMNASAGVIVLDVSDPANLSELDMVTVSGNYLSSRYTGDAFLLMTEFRVKNNPDFSEEKNFLPLIDSGNGPESVAAEDIMMPETITTARYTVVCKLDGDTFALEDSAAFLSYSEKLYVSEEMIYATRGMSETVETGQSGNRKAMTEIAGLSYAGEGMEQKGTIRVDGYVKDQYSLDEHEGILRVVTTTEEMQYQIEDNGMIASVSMRDRGTSANLYCIRLEDWQVVAKVIEFAPKGETVRSVRFDGDMAYVCTAVQVTDPVFFFDLSDLENITYKETGNIEGFSNSLINFRDGYLLGIGVGANRSTLKLEVYEESEIGVESVCKYELENVSYSEDYKDYYVNREGQMVGMGIHAYRDELSPDGQRERYLVVFFDGYELRELLNVPLPGDVDLKRAVYIDGYFYLFGEDAFVVEKMGG